MNNTEDNIRKAETSMQMLTTGCREIYTSVKVPYGPIFRRLGGFFTTGIEWKIHGVTKIVNTQKYHTFRDSKAKDHVCYDLEDAKNILFGMCKNRIPEGVDLESCVRISTDDNGNTSARIFYRFTA